MAATVGAVQWDAIPGHGPAAHWPRHPSTRNDGGSTRARNTVSSHNSNNQIFMRVLIVAFAAVRFRLRVPIFASCKRPYVTAAQAFFGPDKRVTGGGRGHFLRVARLAACHNGRFGNYV